MQQIEDIWDKVYRKNKLPWMTNSIPESILSEFINKFNKEDVILDYGCGDGFFTELFINNKLNVISSDISKEALNLVKKRNKKTTIIKTDNPTYFKDKYEFDGLFIWGVMHHIERQNWKEYLTSFKYILKENGYIFIGGHTKENKEFSKGFRTSPTTKLISFAIDDLEEILKSLNFKIERKGVFEFKEATDLKKVKLKYFLAKKE